MNFTNATKVVACDIDNGPLYNIVQLPLLTTTIVLVAAVSRNLCTTYGRSNRMAWRADVYRNSISNVTGLTTLLSASFLTTACHITFFVQLVIVDLVIGSIIDGLFYHLLLLHSGVKLGNYGDPFSKKEFVQQTGICMLLSGMARSCSVALTLLIYQRSHWVENSPNLMQYVGLLIPVLYFGCRDCMLQGLNHEAYVKYYSLVHTHTTAEMQTEMSTEHSNKSKSGSDSSDEENTTKNSEHAEL